MNSVFIISAPSGSGKSTLVKRLFQKVPGLMFSVSYTTREPRGLEREGESYRFISKQEFEERLAGASSWSTPACSATTTGRM